MAEIASTGLLKAQWTLISVLNAPVFHMPLAGSNDSNFLCLRRRSLFKCQGGGGGRLKSRGGGGHVNFHEVSSGVALNFDFPVGGVMLILLIIPIKKPLPFHLIFQNVAGFWGAFFQTPFNK